MAGANEAVRLAAADGLLRTAYLAADVVGQTAIGELDIAVTLEYHDLRGTIEPPQSCRRPRTCGNTADDHHLHSEHLPLQGALTRVLRLGVNLVGARWRGKRVE